MTKDQTAVKSSILPVIESRMASYRAWQKREERLADGYAEISLPVMMGSAVTVPATEHIRATLANAVRHEVDAARAEVEALGVEVDD